jgi:hypothetical protein
MKKNQKRQQPIADIPTYLSAAHAEQASEELTQSYSLLNSSIHVFTSLSDAEKKLYLDAMKNWLQAVDV